MVEAAGGGFTVMGNINTTTLRNGPAAEIERQVGEIIDAGVHVISPGCAVSPECPNAHLRAMADAIRRCEGAAVEGADRRQPGAV